MNEEQINIRIAEAEQAIKKNGYYINYRHNDIHTFSEIERVCRPFLNKGYYAKINYFADGRKPYQCYIIQKESFDLSRQGQQIISEILH